MTVHVTVRSVNIPAMSTVGTGTGRDDEGRIVTFAGDHRPMRDIGEAIAAAATEDDLPQVDVEDYAVLYIGPVIE